MTFVLTLEGAAARAQELDAILPASIPGYGTPFAVTGPHRASRLEATGFVLGDLASDPAVTVAEGYDSAPNGQAASPVTTAAPRMVMTDPIMGLGIFAAADFAEYPEDAAQDISGATLAAGERLVLPEQTVTLAGGWLRAQETGFDLDTVAAARPVAYDVLDARGSDEVTLGLFRLKPEAEVTAYRFPDVAAQDRTDERAGLTASYVPGGPVQMLVRLHATQSDYRDRVFNADTDQALLGVVDTADGLWTVSALAGVARRSPHAGPDITAPVLEAGLDWMPTRLDKVRLVLAREIDDPDEVSAAAYTLNQAKISLEHGAGAEVLLDFTADVSNAAYFRSSLRETLVRLHAGASWQMGRNLALDAAYDFNDRQANLLPAANEHVVTVGVTWTP